jgi:L,D-transpeptidase catalytic domain/Putative peptidoglycan binding domain
MKLVPLFPEQRLAEQAPRRGWLRPVLTGALVIAVEAGVVAGAGYAAVRYWPALRVAAAPSALARVTLAPFGERVTKLEVLDGARRVGARLQAGFVEPNGHIAPGTRLRVVVTVHRSRWVGWLLGATEQVTTVVRAPEAALSSQFVYPHAGRPVQVRFTQPVRLVGVRTRGSKLRVLRFVTPRRVVSIGPVAAGTDLAGTAFVAGAVRPWERLPDPVRVNWFPAGPAPQVLVRPAPKSTLVPSAPIVLTFSRPIADVLGTARPSVLPRVQGTWRQPNDHTLVFQPSGLGFPLGSHVRLRLPRAIRVIAGSDPSSFRTLTWPVPRGSPLRLRELLAQLGYLPVTWQPDRSELSATPAAQARAAVDPPAGTFDWRYAKTPAALKALWSSGAGRPIVVRGALMAFQATHGLPVDGYPGRAVWKALLGDVVAGKPARGGYSYVYVTETLPQTLTLWHNGHVVLRTPVNTGIASRPTALGTFPVYAHLTSTTMSGINPDGTPYHDPGVPWVNYFNGGDAVHGFVRGGYGWPQSLGCVEVPIPTAAQIFPYVQLGTLVTVAA